MLARRLKSERAPIVVSAVLGPALLILSCSSSALAGPITIRINETGDGSYDLNDKKGFQSMAGAMRPDPKNGNAMAWSYVLPAQAKATDGDIIANDPPPVASLPDLIRFVNNTVFIYSRNVERFEQDKPRVPIPPGDIQGQLPANTATTTFTEITTDKKPDKFDDNNNGITYSPVEKEPGFGPNNNLFLFVSDLNSGNIKSIPAINKYIEIVPDVKSMGKSVSFDASQQKLTIADDVVTSTGYSNDAMANAHVDVPSFTLTGHDANGHFFFAPSAGDVFDITGSNTFFQGHLDGLTYSTADNTFSGRLSDFSFGAGQGSPWADRGNVVFDPTSANFDPNNVLFFSYVPDSDFLALTQSFTVDGTSGGTNGISGANVPEPSTLCLVALAFGAIASRRAARRPMVQG